MDGELQDKGLYGKLKTHEKLENDKKESVDFKFKFACRSENYYLFCFEANSTSVFARFTYKEVLTKSIDGQPLLDKNTKVILLRKSQN